MKKHLLFIFIIFIFTSGIYAVEKKNIITDEETFFFPAEFEKHESIWLAWSDEKYRAGMSSDKVVISILKALSPFVKIDLIVKDEQMAKLASEAIKANNILIDNIKFHMIPVYSRWLRDSGPVFVKNRNADLAVIDFKFNFYGLLDANDPECLEIEKENILIADSLKLRTLPIDLASEGGNREFNGKGTMISVRSVELDRNPDKDIKYLEDSYKKLFGVKKIIWLKKGLLTDDTYYRGPIADNIFSSSITNGHIDEFCRFVSPDTVLLAEISREEKDKDPINKESYKRLEENYNILKKATDQDGNPLKIVRIPAANNIIIKNYRSTEKIIKLYKRNNNDDNDMIDYAIAASYMNFLVTNGVVLMPKYWKEGRNESIRIKDEKAKNIIQSVFPDRKIIQIDAEAVNHGGGGIHCITQQEPVHLK